MTRLDAALRELAEALREELRTEAEAGPRTPDQLHDLTTAAGLMSLGRSRLYAEIGAGRLRTVKVGRRRLVPASAIADYIERAAAP